MNIISSVLSFLFPPEAIGACCFLSKLESQKDHDQFSRHLYIYYIHFGLPYQYFTGFCKEEPAFLAALLPEC